MQRRILLLLSLTHFHNSHKYKYWEPERNISSSQIIFGYYEQIVQPSHNEEATVDLTCVLEFCHLKCKEQKYINNIRFIHDSLMSENTSYINH